MSERFVPTFVVGWLTDCLSWLAGWLAGYIQYSSYTFVLIGRLAAEVTHIEIGLLGAQSSSSVFLAWIQTDSNLSGNMRPHSLSLVLYDVTSAVAKKDATGCHFSYDILTYDLFWPLLNCLHKRCMNAFSFHPTFSQYLVAPFFAQREGKLDPIQLHRSRCCNMHTYSRLNSNREKKQETSLPDLLVQRDKP